jgi:outer membrane immunogenic protein
MVRVSSIGVAALALALGSAAQAQQPVFSWTGFYVGAGVGWDRLSTNGDYRLIEDGVETFSTRVGRTGNGVQGHFFAGYGMNWGPWFASAELGVGASSTEAKRDFSFTTDDYYEVQTRLRQYWSIVPSVRGGYLVTPELLAFLRFGWAFTDTKLSYTAIEIEGGTVTRFAGSTRRWLNGPQVGGGVEYAILPNLRLRADGSFTWLSRISVTGAVPPAADSDVNAVSSRPQQGLLLFSAIFVF